MEEYSFSATPGSPPVKFLYLHGWHKTDWWQEDRDLNVIKLNFFIEGYFHLIINSRAFVVSPGDVILYRPHELHHGNIPYDQNMEYFELQLDPESLSGLYGGRELTEPFVRRTESWNLVRPTSEQRIRLEREFRRLLSAAAEGRQIQELGIVIGILSVLSELRHTSLSVEEGGYYPAPLLGALNAIHTGFHEELSNADIAQTVHVTPSYLNRIFRQYLACSPHEYLQELRLKEACLLLAGGTSVSDACFGAGFSSLSAFGVLFRRKTGIPPSEYRKLETKKPPER